MTLETVAAISTPHSQGGISVIRISGEKALEIADKIFYPVSSRKKPSEMEGYTCAYGKFLSASGEQLDDGILTVFREPHSYTGEDTIEISCHGGIFVTEQVLSAVYERGAVPAGQGEFTKRAFLNGKLTLTQAESVMDIISAEGRAFYRRAQNVKDGALFKKASGCGKRLLTLLGEISAWIDYPEDDIPSVNNDNLLSELNEILKELNKIRSAYENTKILKTGADTVIAGKPNVGKSTLMNLLTGYDRSIVTEIAGTTRDVVEETVRLGDITLRLSDTAGLRETDDVIESAGIERTKKRLERADLIIAVFDNSVPLDKDDLTLMELCKNAEGVKSIACINKTDKPSIIEKEKISAAFDNVIEISAENGDGADKLQKVLYDLFLTDSNNYTGELTVNKRQKQCLDKAVSCIEEAKEAIESSITLDAVNIILDEALNALQELTGERATETVVDEVFSRFCVGK